MRNKQDLVRRIKNEIQEMAHEIKREYELARVSRLVSEEKEKEVLQGVSNMNKVKYGMEKILDTVERYNS